MGGVSPHTPNAPRNPPLLSAAYRKYGIVSGYCPKGFPLPVPGARGRRSLRILGGGSSLRRSTCDAPASLRLTSLPESSARIPLPRLLRPWRAPLRGCLRPEDPRRCGGSPQRPVERGCGSSERNGSERAKVTSVAEGNPPASRGPSGSQGGLLPGHPLPALHRCSVPGEGTAPNERSRKRRRNSKILLTCRAVKRAFTPLPRGPKGRA